MVLSAQQLYASADNIRFELIDVDDGLSQQTVKAIFQDSRGLMWFGTQEGLNKYDGVDFEIYTPQVNDPASISSPWINSITEDNEGNLWVATDNGVNVLDRNTNKFTRLTLGEDSSSASGKIARVVFKDSLGHIWVATTKGINKYIAKEKRFKPYTFINADGQTIDIFAMAEDLSGALWLGSDSHGLLRFDPQREKMTVIKSSLQSLDSDKKSGIRSLFIDTEQVLWIGTNGSGLHRLDLTQSKPKRMEDAVVLVDSFENKGLSVIAQDDKKTLWVGSERGLFYRKLGSEKFIPYLKGSLSGKALSEQEILALYSDRSGVFWVGSFNGLNKWNTRTTQFDHLYAGHGGEFSLSANNITTIARGFGKLYIGTTEGVNQIDLKTGETRVLPVSKDGEYGLSGPKVMSIAVVSEEEIWFAQRSTGATKYNPKTEQYKHYKYDPEDPTTIGQTGIPSAIVTQEGEVWFGAFRGGLSRYNRDTDDFTRFKHDDTDISTLSSDAVFSVHQSATGTIWVGTWKSGLNIFVPETETAFRIPNNIDDPNRVGNAPILVIMDDQDGNIWLGTQGAGIKILTAENLDRGRFIFEKLQVNDGLPSNVIYGLIEDDDGFIWGSTNRGLVKIDRNTREITTFNVDQGIQANEFNSGSYFRDDEYLYFGGANGVTRFRPQDIQPNLLPPPIELTNFQRLNQVSTIAEATNQNGVIEISYTDYLIGLEFAALDYSSPSSNKYKYMLEGFDKDWVEVRDVRRATYTNLPSGEYNFKVIASNSDGVWNTEGKSITLLVHPAPWLSWWAYVMYVSVALIIAWFVAMHFKRKAKLNLDYQIKLEEEVNERTAELSEVNQQLLHASITDQLTGLHNRRYLSDAIVDRLEDITRRFADKLIVDEIGADNGPRLMALMFDLDGFKPVNDNYGHEAGDQVIVQVAQILQRECRADDIVIRWGGDEYMVVAEVDHVSQASELAERIRTAIADHGFDVGLPNRFHLSSSLGFALYPFSHYAPHSISWDQVHLLADQALYKSKDAGRNTWTGIVQQAKELPFSTLNSLVPNLEECIAKNDVRVLQRTRREEPSIAPSRASTRATDLPKTAPIED